MSSILKLFKNQDIYQIKRYISRNSGLFDTYLLINPPYTSTHLIFVAYLVKIYQTDELIFINLCHIFNQHLNFSRSSTLITLREIVFIAINKYLTYGKELQYIKFVEAFFQHIQAFTSTFITEIFYQLLFNSNIYKFFFLSRIDSSILNVFLPQIPFHQSIDIMKYSPSTQWEKILDISFDDIHLYNIDFTFILYRANLFNEICELYRQKYNLIYPSCDFNWEREYSSTQKQSNTIIEHTFHKNRYNNYLQLQSIEHFMNTEINNSGEFIDQLLLDLEEKFKNVDLTLRLHHNVSPFLLCKNIATAKIMNKFEVDKSNTNGLFYIYLSQQYDLFLYMINIGINPISSIFRLQSILKSSSINKNHNELNQRLTLLNLCYKEYKQPLFNLLFKHTPLCSNLCNIVVEYL